MNSLISSIREVLLFVNESKEKFLAHQSSFCAITSNVIRPRAWTYFGQTCATFDFVILPLTNDKLRSKIDTEKRNGGKAYCKNRK